MLVHKATVSVCCFNRINVCCHSHYRKRIKELEVKISSLKADNQRLVHIALYLDMLIIWHAFWLGYQPAFKILG